MVEGDLDLTGDSIIYLPKRLSAEDNFSLRSTCINDLPGNLLVDTLSTRRKFRGHNAEYNVVFQPAMPARLVEQSFHSDKTASPHEYRFIRQVDFVIGLFALIRNLCQESDYPSFR